ncbi:MAG: MarR family transcriptional regulator [Bacteroidales bacterium]|nr:MarR family transcriptional regulator [Bacteroidales bacterium]
MQVQEREVFSILTGKISTTINRALLRAFAQEDLRITTEQWTVLACLWNEDKVTQRELCDLTSKDKPSMTRLIDNLERNKFVVRVSHATDRRVNLIHLTQYGASLHEKISGVVQRVVSKSLADISEEEISIARTVLNKIIKNLDA